MRCVHWSPLFIILAASLFATGQSPVAGPNVNMVSGTQWPGGDPYLQRQNEPSLAVSTRNPQHLLSGANDYRTVDIPFPEDSGSDGLPSETGDAWLGVFKSTDGGQTWFSTLVPGYPQDKSAVGSLSPLKAYSVATDPTVRSGTHGMIYYSGLAFTRGSSGTSAVFVTRFRDENNKGNGDPFSYLSASIIETGTSGQFLDKPWLVVDIPRTTSVGSATCTINGKTFTSGNVYLVYSVFLGSNPANNPHSQINFVKSTNCGATWSKPTKLSESFTLNQGTVAAIDPGTGALYIAWRQISTVNQPDSILYAVSTNGGQTFTKAATAFQFPTKAAFDQLSSPSAFRTIALPALTVDGNGRVFLAWSQRNIGPYNTARVMMSTLPRGGTTWSTPFLVDPTATGPGHQFLPSLSFAYGKLMMAFYDFREDQTSGVLQCPAGQTCSNTGDFVEVRVPQGDLAGGNAADVYTPVVSDAGLKRRHTIDVRGAEADPSTFNSALNPPLNFSGFRISQYKYGSRPGSTKIEQMQFNPPNFPLFVKGTRAFMGDYIEIAALPFLVDASGKWTFNSQKSNAPVFHATWTDNRDVRPPPVTCDPATGICTQNWSLYTPVASTGEPSIYDTSGKTPKPACVPTQTGSRNENIYTSRISEGLIVGIRENTKPLNSSISLQRAFAVTVQNNTNKIAYYRLSFVQPLPANTTASFSQTQSSPTLDVSVGPRSSIARLAFLSSASPTAQVGVLVSQISAVGGTVLIAGLGSTAIVNPDITNPDITNPDITNPDITNPDITNPDITNPDIHTAEIYNPTVTNPNITNPDITNPDITNPDITNPDITNPDITNPDITNPDINSLVVTNPDITNPDITNPDITNPDITNPDITNPDITSLSTGATDFTWKLTNRGNTTSSYNAKLQSSAPVCCPAGCPGANSCPASCNKCQLILRRTYTTPIANACQLTVESQNVPVTSVPDPAFADGSTVQDPDLGPQITNATISLGPGQAGRITLRVFGLTTTQIPPGFLKASGISLSANTGNVPAAASLTITTLVLPSGFVGQPYSASLQSIGGVGLTRAWSIFSGSLPSGLSLNPATGQVTGVVAGGSGSTSFVAQVIDSPSAPTQPQIDRQTITLNVNDLRIINISAAKAESAGQTLLKGGDMVTVAVDVRSTGSTPASSVTPLALTVNASGANASCAAALPASASIAGDTTQTFTYTCGPVSGDGSLTFTAQVTGAYNSGSGTVTLITPPVTSNPISVDSAPPLISVTATTADGPYTVGNWTNRDVAVVFQCSDANGIASGYPTGNITITSDTSSAGQTVSGKCIDVAGNVSTLNFGPVRVDKTAPVISATRTPAANPAGWNNSPVTVSFTCSDLLSGSASLSPSTTLSNDGLGQDATGSCTDNAGNIASASVSGINIDQTTPVITITLPISGGIYSVFTPIAVNYTCTDGLSGLSTCSGPVASGSSITVSAGANAITVTATDVAGNSSSASVNFQGAGYSFSGFLSPMVAAGSYSAPSQAGSFNFGKAVPIKWQVRDAQGAFVANNLASLKLMRAISNLACTGAPAPGGQTVVLYIPTNGATGGSTFRYDTSNNQYIFNWDTSFASRGCFNLVVDLADGSTYATIVKLQ